jgi:sugar-phosphatase
MILRASALLFDNDGVLVDSHAAVDVAWGILGQEFGLEGFSISNHYGTRAQDLILELVGEASRSIAFTARWYLDYLHLC